MKKLLAVFLSGAALAAAAEQVWKNDFHSDKVAEIVKQKERYVSVCDSVLTFQIPARWMTIWGASAGVQKPETGEAVYRKDQRNGPAGRCRPERRPEGRWRDHAPCIPEKREKGVSGIAVCIPVRLL